MKHLSDLAKDPQSIDDFYGMSKILVNIDTHAPHFDSENPIFWLLMSKVISIMLLMEHGLFSSFLPLFFFLL